jgi:hypothetical protein
MITPAGLLITESGAKEPAGSGDLGDGGETVGLSGRAWDGRAGCGGAVDED